MRPLMKTSEVAEFLGISTKTLYNQRYRGEEPGSLGRRVNGLVRWRFEDLESYLEVHRSSRGS